MPTERWRRFISSWIAARAAARRVRGDDKRRRGQESNQPDLVYSCDIAPLGLGGNRVRIEMSMTAPCCGMRNVLKADVESKLSRLSGVKEVHVEVVFDPAWHPGLMWDAAKLQLGFNLDYETTNTSRPIYGERT